MQALFDQGAECLNKKLAVQALTNLLERIPFSYLLERIERGLKFLLGNK
jgi:hypothetical protein